MKHSPLLFGTRQLYTLALVVCFGMPCYQLSVTVLFLCSWSLKLSAHVKRLAHTLWYWCTTNSFEGWWHRAFEQRINIKQPTGTHMIEKMHIEQNSWEVKLQQLQCGIPRKKPCSKHANLNQRIKDIASIYAEDSSLDYLKVLASNI